MHSGKKTQKTEKYDCMKKEKKVMSELVLLHLR